MKMRNAVIISLLLLMQSCILPRHTAIPSDQIPHKLAEDASVFIWVRRADGKLQKEAVNAQAGWWIASPRVVER